MLMAQPGLHCMTASGPDPATRRAFVELLRFADPEIDDVAILGGDDPDTSDPRRRLRSVRHDDGEPVLFEIDEESAGTQAWFNLLGPAFAALVASQVLLFDEIDASLHPRLSARLIELFQDPQTNPYRAQLIFTSHDTSLLGALNRDEVWLTEKAPGGATRVVALAEFGGDRVRRSLNLERAYLQGRFGQSIVLSRTWIKPTFETPSGSRSMSPAARAIDGQVAPRTQGWLAPPRPRRPTWPRWVWTLGSRSNWGTSRCATSLGTSGKMVCAFW